MAEMKIELRLNDQQKFNLIQEIVESISFKYTCCYCGKENILQFLGVVQCQSCDRKMRVTLLIDTLDEQPITQHDELRILLDEYAK
jgi:hypothetical protein